MKGESLRLGFYASWAFPRSYIKLLFAYRVFAEVVVIGYNRKGAVDRYGDIGTVISVISSQLMGYPCARRAYRQ
jgi:hypothetical protein